MRKPRLCVKKNRSATHPWRIEGHRENGKRKRFFFRTRQEAELALARLSHVQAKEGEDSARLDMTQRADAVRALAILSPLGVTLEAAARAYAERMAAMNRSRPVSDVIAELAEAKEKDGASQSHLVSIRGTMKRFARAFPSEPVASLDTTRIDDWLRSLPVGPATRNRYRRYLILLFNFAVVRGYCASNPVTRTARAKTVATPPEIFTPEDTARILATAAAKVPETLPFFAIGFFAGVRVAEIERLNWQDIRLDRRFIEVSAANAKTSSRRLVRIEDNLAAWLAPFARKSGPVCGPNFRKLFDKARRLSGVKWKDNGMRHSFASYHLARGQDAAATALQLGHPNTNMLFAHYRELVEPEAAARYFAIVPDAGLSNVIPMPAAAS